MKSYNDDQMNQMKEFYDKSDYYENNLKKFLDLNNAYQSDRIRSILELYSPNKDETILDLGCGWGTFCFALAEQCKNIVGVDFSTKSIEICQKLAIEKNLPAIEFKCADARCTGLARESFDVVICADLVEHLYPRAYEDSLKEIKRILKRGGKLIIWTPNRGHLIEMLKNRNIIFKKDISHVDYKSMNRLINSLERQGFLIRKAYYKESHVPFIRIIEKLFMKFFPFVRRRIAILAEK